MTMKVIAICFENDLERQEISKDLMSCFRKRCCNVSLILCKSAIELQRTVSKKYLPDIMIYDRYADNERFHKAAYILSQHKKDMLTIAIGVSQSSKFNTEYMPTYLIPQFSTKVLWSHVCKAYDSLSSDENHFIYYKRPQYVTTPLSDILYFSSEGRRIRLISQITDDSENEFYDKLDNVEEQLSKKKCHFVRIHKSYLVNTQYIASYDKNHLKLITGECLNISKYSYYKNLSFTLSSKHKSPVFN